MYIILLLLKYAIFDNNLFVLQIHWGLKFSIHLWLTMKFNIAYHDQSMKFVNFVPNFHRAFSLDEMNHLTKNTTIFSSMLNQFSLLGFTRDFRPWAFYDYEPLYI